MKAKHFLPLFISIFVIGFGVLIPGIVFLRSSNAVLSTIAPILLIMGGIIAGFVAIGLIVIFILLICKKVRSNKEANKTAQK